MVERTTEELAKRAASQRVWRAKNVEKARATNRDWSDRNKAHIKDYQLRLKYDITLDQWYRMVERQQGLCAVCCRWMFDKPKDCHVDHRHDNGAVRELLCANCNRAIGHGMEDPEILRAAADYIERHR